MWLPQSWPGQVGQGGDEGEHQEENGDGGGEEGGGVGGGGGSVLLYRQCVVEDEQADRDAEEDGDDDGVHVDNVLHESLPQVVDVGHAGGPFPRRLDALEDAAKDDSSGHEDGRAPGRGIVREKGQEQTWKMSAT